MTSLRTSDDPAGATVAAIAATQGAVDGAGLPATPPIFAGLGGRAAVVIVVLMLVNVVNFVDRHLPFILIESIKAELKLTDGQIGLLAGLSFAVVFSFAALPLAWLADRWSAKAMMIIT